MAHIGIEVHKKESQICILVEAYLGLVPRELSSGETQRRGRITTAGPERSLGGCGARSGRGQGAGRGVQGCSSEGGSGDGRGRGAG